MRGSAQGGLVVYDAFGAFDGLGRGSYVVGAQWDEGNMVHAMKRFGGTTVGWRFGDG